MDITKSALKNRRNGLASLLYVPGLVCCWNFSEDEPYRSLCGYTYTLLEGNGTPLIIDGGVIGNRSIELTEGKYLYVPRQFCPELNIYGEDAAVTVLAWVRRQPKSYSQCEAIAGMWNETQRLRQYCLFLNLQLFDSANQVCGHISGVGGPTTGERWCIDASIGKTEVRYNEWAFAGFTYDGESIRSYLNGELDLRPGGNPYSYKKGIFDARAEGSDFTIGAVDRSGEMGNFFVGQISGIAVFNRALETDEIKKIHSDFPLPED